jgi:hypothetical protein
VCEVVLAEFTSVIIENARRLVELTNTPNFFLNLVWLHDFYKVRPEQSLDSVVASGSIVFGAWSAIEDAESIIR